jgi:hypothetical protein
MSLHRFLLMRPIRGLKPRISAALAVLLGLLAVTTGCASISRQVFALRADNG